MDMSCVKNNWPKSKIFSFVFTAMLVVPLILRFQYTILNDMIINPGSLVSSYELVVKNLEIWRPFTAFLVSGVNLSWVISLFLFLHYGKALSEKQGKPKDELVMYLILIIASNVVGWTFDCYSYYNMLVNAVIYSRKI